MYTQYSSPGVATILKGKRNSLLNRCETAPRRTEGKPGLMGQNFLAGAIKESLPQDKTKLNVQRPQFKSLYVCVQTGLKLQSSSIPPAYNTVPDQGGILSLQDKNQRPNSIDSPSPHLRSICNLAFHGEEFIKLMCKGKTVTGMDVFPLSQYWAITLTIAARLLTCLAASLMAEFNS